MLHLTLIIRSAEGCFPSLPVNIISAMSVVCRIRARRLAKVFCAVLCTTVVHNDMHCTHTYKQFVKLTVDVGFL